MIPAVIEKCAGIDVGKKLVVACLMTGPAKDPAQAETRKFGTVRSWSDCVSGSGAKTARMR